MKALNDFSFESENCQRFNGTKLCYKTRATFTEPEKKQHDGHFRVQFLDERK
jgi:hypothetical protein